jgi:hypothetical protein
MNLGEPLRCITIAAPFYGAAIVILLASGYPLHHLRAFRARWFRCYPSRFCGLRPRIKNEKYLLANEKRISLHILNKKQLYL